MIEKLEKQLDSFDEETRFAALSELIEIADRENAVSVSRSDYVNMHCHTFFSFNSYGYSPVKYAWLAYKNNLALAGIVDFDVLDGIDEFVRAGRMLGLRTCGGMETRVFVPEFADKQITSPGEPGITYHMAVGLPTGSIPSDLKSFQQKLLETAQQRNKDLIKRVNAYLDPVIVDYEKDVLPLVPAGNPTERHICLAYAVKARDIIGIKDLAGYWTEKLSTDVSAMEMPQGREILNTIRAKTMKKGGAGYTVPDAGAFPKMADTNRFILAAGGIPTLTWLNGCSDGEKEIEKLLEIAMSTGVEAVNIIPDRNFTPGVKDQLLENLQQFITLADSLDLPIVVGTEMNSPGQRFVDNFGSNELSPYVELFLKGAYIIYGHSVMQRQCSMGYTSQWAGTNFVDRKEKNRFFEKLGKAIDPKNEGKLAAAMAGSKPDEILEMF